MEAIHNYCLKETLRLTIHEQICLRYVALFVLLSLTIHVNI